MGPGDFGGAAQLYVSLPRDEGLSCRKPTRASHPTVLLHHSSVPFARSPCLTYTDVVANSPHSDQTIFLRENVRFAVDLYAALKRQSGNLVFSPYTVSVAMAMLYAGARRRTADQILAALSFPFGNNRLHAAVASVRRSIKTELSGSAQVDIADSLWVETRCALSDLFPALIQEYYDAAVSRVSFQDAPRAAQQQINEWIREHTRGRMTNLIDDIDPVTRVLAVATVYFKSRWLNHFRSERTREMPFHRSTQDSVAVRMMSCTGTLSYGESGQAQVLQLPYVGAGMSMLILLPKSVDGLTQLENALSADELNRCVNCCERARFTAVVPRFRLHCGIELENALKSMGVLDAFDSERADLSGLAAEKLYVQSVVHGACIDVDEEGTEATAATTVRGATGRPQPPSILLVDHPFVYLLLHEQRTESVRHKEKETGCILFMGKVTDPSRSQCTADA